MLDCIRNLFKKEQPKQKVRVCNRCGFIWRTEEDPTGKTFNSNALCPDCFGIDTQVTTDWHREHSDLIKERRVHYLESIGRKEKDRKSA